MKWTKVILPLGAATAITLSACSSQATAGTGGGSGDSSSAAQVSLNPATGMVNSTPTWSTAVGCPAGHRGSAVFREVHHDGTTNNISAVTNQVVSPFSGKLEGPLPLIKQLGSIPNGHTQQFVMICFAGPSATGTLDVAMSVYITYSADGTRYTTGATRPA